MHVGARSTRSLGNGTGCIRVGRSHRCALRDARHRDIAQLERQIAAQANSAIDDAADGSRAQHARNTASTRLAGLNRTQTIKHNRTFRCGAHNRFLAPQFDVFQMILV